MSVASRFIRCLPLLLGLPALAAPGVALANGGACRAVSPAAPVTVVELYTSEGCSSCPPAERWLSTLGHGGAVVALAFHVDYWDSLGWKDRFADPAFTQRQQALQRGSGARFVYTPQVVVDGRDWRGWPRLPAPRPGAAAAQLQIERAGSQASVTVTPQVAARGIDAGAHRGAATGVAGGAARDTATPAFAGYWAIVSDGEVSRVRAGENAGAELHHDHVVRRYQPVPPWPAGEARRWTLAWPAGLPPAARIVFVLTEAASGRPLQAVELGC